MCRNENERAGRSRGRVGDRAVLEGSHRNVKSARINRSRDSGEFIRFGGGEFESNYEGHLERDFFCISISLPSSHRSQSRARLQTRLKKTWRTPPKVQSPHPPIEKVTRQTFMQQTIHQHVLFHPQRFSLLLSALRIRNDSMFFLPARTKLSPVDCAR